MKKRFCSAVLIALSAISLMSGTGCSYNLIFSGPEFGPATFPVPVSPYFQDRKEGRFWEHERYERVPVLGPITAGGPAVALDPPSADEIMRALPRVSGGIPFLYEQSRNNVRIIVEPMCDYVDPPRVYPLIGPAQLHHAHYKCTIYYTGTTRHGWPVPHTLTDEDSAQVIYIDHNHFHMVGNVDGGGSPLPAGGGPG
jgi:hypothetical protein